MKRLLLLIMLPLVLLAGEYADAFMIAAYPAHSLAMGHATVAYQGLSGLNPINPAAAGLNPVRIATVTYHRFGPISNESSLLAQFPRSESWILNFKLIHAGIGDIGSRPALFDLDPIERRDTVRASQGNSWGYLDHREDAIYINASRVFKFNLDLGWKFFEIPMDIPIGLTMKVIDKNLDGNRGLGTGFDAGVLVRAPLGDIDDDLLHTTLLFGISVLDILNTPVYWETEHQDAIKRRTVKGMSVQQGFPAFNSQIILSTSTNALHGNQRQYGAEIRFKDRLNLRAGHDGEDLAFGVGLGYKKFNIDYAFGQHDLAGKQKIGVVYHF